MLEYSALIDEQVSRMMELKGRVTVDQLAGLLPEDAAEMLQRYSERHADGGPFVFDGQVLSRARVQVAPGAGAVEESTPAAARTFGSGRSPVDEVLSAPPKKALLDSAPSGGRVSKWMIALPVSLALPGGLLAWFLVRGENPRAARNLLILGIVIQILSLASIPLMGSLFPGR